MPYIHDLCSKSHLGCILASVIATMLFIDDGLSLLLYRLLNKQYQLNSCSHYEYSAKMSSTNKLKGWLQDILR